MIHSVFKKPHHVAWAFFGSLCLAELLAVLWINQGEFAYALDDPYIHMALAENLRTGHYGLNAHEVSAPSSSLLWPFLLVPFASWHYGPLLLNILAGLASIYAFDGILRESLPEASGKGVRWAFLVLLILATNQVGMVFMGMEHGLQVALVAWITLGMIQVAKESRRPVWLPWIAGFAPWVRYENAAVSLAAILFLCLRGKRKAATGAAVVAVAGLGLFSVFLWQRGLGFLPSSVLVKSDVAGAGASWQSLLRHLAHNLGDRRGAILSLGAWGLLAYGLMAGIRKASAQAALCALLAIGLHLAVGRFGWFNRYELYIWTHLLLMGSWLLGNRLWRPLDQKPWIRPLLTASFLLCAGPQYFLAHAQIPMACRNTRLQHAQLRRFAADFYKQAVAVNDIGYVSWRNPQAVLDLWGLGSTEAMAARRTEKDGQWMDRLASAQDVGIAMIYDSWFPKKPAHWILLGKLSQNGPIISLGHRNVSFYALNPKAADDAVLPLSNFAAALPRSATWIPAIP